MASVTQRIAEINQPRGGYLPRKNFEVIELDDSNYLVDENISPGIVGLAVDYLTRFLISNDVENSFSISLAGAQILDISTGKNRASKMASKLIDNIKGLDDLSISSACKLVGFDVCFRAGVKGYRPVEEIIPDTDTINNIRIMVNRSLEFISEYGPIVVDGFTFEGGYTKIIDSGDGDFLTADTLWDFKVSKNEPTSKQTLQILVYYLMGKHSKHKYFDDIKRVGIFNPRLNKVYLYEIDNLSNEIIDEVSNYVIGYGDIAKDHSVNSEDNDLLTLKELSSRYGIGTAKITKDLIPMGLPYSKKGNAYRFNRDELLAWEIKTRYIPYRNGEIELPGYSALKIYLRTQLKSAKKSKDKVKVKKIKILMKENGMYIGLSVKASLIIFLAIVIILLGGIYFILGFK